MTSLPTGTVTFLFTDIEGSTRLWEQHPDAMKQALARHDALLREVIAGHGGQIFKTVGDGVYAVFAAAPEALAAARETQQKLAAESWAVPGGVRVRMAVHTGRAEARDGDYFGPALNRVARLLAAGHGGQILVSEATSALVADDLPPEVSLQDRGRFRLKDLARPEQVFQIIAPGLPTDFPPLRTLDTLPNNLPRQLTNFVGRERELSEIKDRLTTTPLLTLTGPGGSGKTRLALQAGADLIEKFEDGVWLVELATVSDPKMVEEAVAATLGVRNQIDRPSLLNTLTDFLRTRSLLLLMDNCEHLRTVCADLVTVMLRASPRLRILATSQVALGVEGEVTYQVPPLSMPDPARLPALDDLKMYESVRLFVDRAVLSQPRFALTARNAPAVAQICARLDGIPLAIELAAARVRALSVEDIAARLDDRFRLLTSGMRTVPPQHQTLQATLDWSYNLLTLPEQVVLRFLSVFAGGCTLEAVEAICATDDSKHTELLDALTSLVDRSLVRFEEDEPRYRLLETIRLYAREKLVAAGEEPLIRTRHRDWYLKLAETAASLLSGPEQTDGLVRMDREYENMKAALEWSLLEPEGADSGLRLSGALWRFWVIRGYWSEGREWLERTLSKTGDLDSPARVKVLNGAAYLAFYQDDVKRAKELADEALTVSRRLNDRRGTAFCLTILGLEACRIENYKEAREFGEQSLALSRELGEADGIAGSLLVLGLVARDSRETEKAVAYFNESLTYFATTGDKVGTGFVLTSLGLVLREMGDLERARHAFEEALALFQELGDKWGIAFSLSNLGILAWSERNYERAEMRFRESLVLRQELGDRRGLATSLIGRAAVATAQNQMRRAAVLFGAAEALREAISVPPPPFIRDGYDQLVAETRTALGEPAFTTAWTEGRSMTLDQAIDFALSAVPV
ncbi:MAG TPA: tetratricopeptide repeat protein [bacterium]|jgi:predicted ATPase/class 3 adenylate cyclase